MQKVLNARAIPFSILFYVTKTNNLLINSISTRAHRHDPNNMHYLKSMNQKLSTPTKQKGFDKVLFDKRVKGYKECSDPYKYQQATKSSFL